MSSRSAETMLSMAIQVPSSDGHTAVYTMHSNSSHSATYAAVKDGCFKVVFSEMEYLPWDNPDNIVSAEVEVVSRRFKDIVLAFMFLIGGPANVINMAVFYKQGLGERVNLCLFALSLADELYMIMSMFSYGEQLHLQFTTGERFGPVLTFITNNHFTVFQGFCYVSPVLSAIIAIERCHCVLRPLSYQTAMSTRAMAVVISAVYLLILGLYFIVAFRYRIGCIYDSVSGAVQMAPIEGEFYRAHKRLVDFMHGLLFGLGLPGLEIVVVATTTSITIVKLRQAVAWRTGTSSTSSLSPREVALTKMLVGSSILFVACLFPFALTRIVWLVSPQMNSGGRHQNFFLSTLWLTQVLIYINSTFNIFVYYIMGSRYRETFWALMGRRRRAGKDVKEAARGSVKTT